MSNIACIEERLVVVAESTGVPTYDFDFEAHFACRHPRRFERAGPCVLRIGAIADYAAELREKQEIGLTLVNSDDEHARASELELWYPRLLDLTIPSRVSAELPPAEEIEAQFGWPVFLKGSRQTSRHDPELSVIGSAAAYRVAAARYREDPILRWQKPVVRAWAALQPVSGEVPGKVRPSAEFRSFWWHGACAGWGRYWYQVPAYRCADVEAGLAIAADAAARLDVPFLVVDFARTVDGRWIVIECNDAQESGYGAIEPRALWRRVLDRIG